MVEINALADIMRCTVDEIWLYHGARDHDGGPRCSYCRHTAWCQVYYACWSLCVTDTCRLVETWHANIHGNQPNTRTRYNSHTSTHVTARCLIRMYCRYTFLEDDYGGRYVKVTQSIPRSRR